MKVCVIGTGYVGATTSVTLAALGHDVVGVDADPRKAELLGRGTLPFFESGLEDLLREMIAAGRLRFTGNGSQAIRDCEVVFTAVGTPSAPDGSADLTAVWEVARQIGRTITDYTVVVNKSTVPVGTGERVEEIVLQELQGRGADVPFDVVSNPEFLREGKALEDALHPDRVVIGAASQRAREVMARLYADVVAPVLWTTVRDAEMIKYASNAFLATKISFVNELARLCERTGADIAQVARGMGMDGRIGQAFLQAGVGYGGSCFPKDVDALLHLARVNGERLGLLESVAEVNRTQTGWYLEKVRRVLGDLAGKRVAVLGLTFKPGTDDIREAPALRILAALLDEGAQVCAYDPQGMAAVRKLVPSVVYASDAYAAMERAEAVLLVTEWQELVELDWQRAFGQVKEGIVFDGRNALDADKMTAAGWRYYGVGKGRLR
ncbi:UDP-glucose/GDP-mannose dehydrogenase family protein [Tumebacillus sp. DT12]|uniref:UDP-glucose 6-dehydrogenase n=1 Tax=Tumebacillus lacus TaxID=2995335 RepID=A0ABT3X1K0_9BACL|nr:UDP-glucose/GDP-mannose dehydrogenase family protein [Tumebacillus lacus]MCX7570796.1 UDP-glucose/GDP-mannose dehydrogenase family protein [Tumebacillus lacus]